MNENKHLTQSHQLITIRCKMQGSGFHWSTHSDHLRLFKITNSQAYSQDQLNQNLLKQNQESQFFKVSSIIPMCSQDLEPLIQTNASQILMCKDIREDCAKMQILIKQDKGGWLRVYISNSLRGLVRLLVPETYFEY